MKLSIGYDSMKSIITLLVFVCFMAASSNVQALGKKYSDQQVHWACVAVVSSAIVLKGETLLGLLVFALGNPVSIALIQQLLNPTLWQQFKAEFN